MDFKKLLENQLVRYALVLIAGVAIGAVFYPTKNVEEKVRKEYEQKIEQLNEVHEKIATEDLQKFTKLMEEKHTMETELNRKITTLTIEVRDLQSKTKETWYKIVKPDGTIEERRFTESEVNEQTRVISEVREEFNQKVREIGERYEAVHRERVQALKVEFDSKEQSYKSTIARLESEKRVEINPKRYGVELGYLSSKEYYGHVNVDVFGPVFLGVHTQTNLTNEHAVGAGVGIRF